MCQMSEITYTTEIIVEPDVQVLENIWFAIESEGSLPFFLSWAWISCWLKTYTPIVIATVAKVNDEPVAVGLFTDSIQKRRGFITAQQFRLNQIGDKIKDQIWIEYNDFICLEGHREQAIGACLKALDHNCSWDEIVLSNMNLERANKITKLIAHSTQDSQRPCYAVDLKSIRQSNSNYLKSLTANTRYQIRRSKRLYEKKYGAIKMTSADNMEQALEFFHQAGPFHILRWSDSGYQNEQFVKFHENLIRSSFDDGQVKLLKIRAGNETIAIMYYHLINNSVYFYLHGLLYEPNSKLKPGLVAHTIATEFFLSQGVDKYDFMGGYSQYKEQLADLSDYLVTVTIQRPRSRFKIERLARNIKKRIVALSRKV